MREETTHSAEEGVSNRVQGQTEVTQKWIHAQKVEERQAHLSHTHNTRRGT